MKTLRALRECVVVMTGVALLYPSVAFAQWAASPGDTVRNVFGPAKGERASMCRGACGLGCPGSCEEQVTYECLDSERLLRVDAYLCGTHQGCRDHDDCLDRCTRDRAQGFDCDAYYTRKPWTPMASSTRRPGPPVAGPMTARRSDSNRPGTRRPPPNRPSAVRTAPGCTATMAKAGVLQRVAPAWIPCSIPIPRPARMPCASRISVPVAFAANASASRPP